jgi:hypothetical protein
MDLHRSESKPVSYDGWGPLNREITLDPSNAAFNASETARAAKVIRPTVLFVLKSCAFSKRVAVSNSSSLSLSCEVIVTGAAEVVEDLDSRISDSETRGP